MLGAGIQASHVQELAVQPPMPWDDEPAPVRAAPASSSTHRGSRATAAIGMPETEPRDPFHGHACTASCGQRRPAAEARKSPQSSQCLLPRELAAPRPVPGHLWPLHRAVVVDAERSASGRPSSAQAARRPPSAFRRQSISPPLPQGEPPSSEGLRAGGLGDAGSSSDQRDDLKTWSVRSAKPRRATKEGQWVLRTPCILEPLFFSARHGSKNPISF